MVKKAFVALTLALVLLLALSTAALAEQRVFDGADIFSADEESQLEAAVDSFRSTYGYDMYILTAAEDDYYASAKERADDFLFEKGYGLSEDGAVCYLIDMYNRENYVSTAGIMIDIINDSRRESIFDGTGSYLQDGDFAGAAAYFISDAAYYADAGIEDSQYRYDSETGEVYQTYKKPNTLGLFDIIIALVLAAAGFFVPRLIIKGQYELRGSQYRYDYTSNSKVAITGRSDQYIRTSVVRTPKPQNNDTDNGGSATHTSSGGGTFGGGGRGF